MEAITTMDGGIYHPVVEQKPASMWDRIWARMLGSCVIGSGNG